MQSEATPQYQISERTKKMKKLRSLLALLLCLVMVLGCMTGCGQKQEEATPAAPVKQEQPAAEPEKAPEQEATPEEAAPAEPVKLTIGLPQNINVENYDTNDYTLWLEETANVDLEFVIFSGDKEEALTQLNLMISAGEELPDILWTFDAMDKETLFELGEDGYLIDLNPYFEEYAEHFWGAYNLLSEADQKNVFALGINPTDGALYGFPSYANSYGDAPLAMTAINDKWLEAVGAEAPETVEELYEVLKKFATEDPNGNGIADEVPAVGSTSEYRADLIQYIINAYVYCHDQYLLNVTDGQVWVPYTTDEYREALIFLNKLIAEGLLSPMTFTITENSEIASFFTPSDGTALSGVVSGHPVLIAETDNEVMLEYSGLAPLTAATELGGYAAFYAPTHSYFTAITADCEDPVAAFKLLDLMSGTDSAKRMRYGVKGRDWDDAPEGTTDNFGIPASVQYLDTNIHTWAKQGNASWHKLNSINAVGVLNTVVVDDGSWTSKRTALCTEERLAYDSREVPAELISDLVYTAEENEIVSECKSLIKDYVKEARGLFATGVMDPSNDADWQSYLDSLEAMNLPGYLEVSQTAYTRMFG